MTLSDEQRQQVTDWITSGLRLSEIQDRMSADFGLRMTYMDARLLVDDLKLTPKDPVVEVAEKPAPPVDVLEEEPGSDNLDEVGSVLPETSAEGVATNVSLSVDTLARPGALVSGKATFSDGQTASWYLDQYGRFGMVPTQEGYRPPQADVAQLQTLLDRELTKLGY